MLKGDRDAALKGSPGDGNKIGPGGLERSTPRTREVPTEVGPTRFRILGRPHRGERNGLGMSI